MFLGGTATVAGLLPSYLTGAMAVEISRDIAFGAAGLGVAVSTFRGAQIVASVPMGRLSDRLGAIWSLRLSLAIAAVTGVGLALSARTWLTLIAWMAVGGLAPAIGQPAANRLVVGRVPPQRLGIGFGVKQSAPPTASMLAGFAVPAVALTLGWRWAYVMGALLGVVIVFLLGKPTPGARPRASARSRAAAFPARGTLTTLVIAFAFASAVGALVPIFYVDAAVQAGTSTRLAGTVLGVAGLAAVTTRLLAGASCDRIAHGHLRLVTVGMGIGSVGLLLLATGTPNVMAAGAVVTLVGTWGFNGVFWFAVIRAFPRNPGSLTGMLLPGGLVGAVAGPLMFGLVAEQFSYRTGWIASLAVAVAAALAMLAGTRRLMPQTAGTGDPADRDAGGPHPPCPGRSAS